MITRVVMPKLTDTMEEGVVVSWKKAEGDTVDAGDVLAEIETDKAVMDLEAFGSGFFRKALANEGDTVQSGSLIALIGELNDDIEPFVTEGPDSVKSNEKTESPPEPSQSKTLKAKSSASKTQKASKPIEANTELPPEEPQKTTDPSSKNISPRARKKAKDKGIELSNIEGSGPDGRIVERDVVQFPQRVPAPSNDVIERPLSQIRKAIARVTTESKAPVPHFYLTADISMTEAERLRAQMNDLQDTSLSITTLLIQAVTLALIEHPEINVSYTGEAIRQYPSIDIGIAVAIDEGLITPVIRDCAHKTLRELSRESFRLIRLARSQKLKPEEYSGATFSISNLGMYAIEQFSAVLVPPQAASLAVGAIQTIPVVESDAIVIDQRMKVTISCDHRALDGAQAARFLQKLKDVLEHPLKLFIAQNM
ncbi:dihydrolipoamide acetyltransferase family protein [Nitrospira sp. M1]